MTTPLHYRSTLDVARAIREREISSREYLDALLARVDALNGPLNVVVTQDVERARQEADEADAALARGDSRGPLHGVAMTIKDSFQTRGMRTTSGAPELADFVPEEDAVPVSRLREAGAVVFGKTNLPIYAGDTQSYNEVFGTSNNPWNVERTPGGSSGGSAAALAAGFTPLELGSDIGGSIRGPASTCGVFGHKPTYGIVPALGQIPGPPGTLTQADIAVAGPMARTTADLVAALDILAGPDDWHSPAYSLSLPAPRQKELSEYRVAVWLEESSAPIDSSVHAVLRNAVDALADAGVTIDESARPDFTFEYATGVFVDLLNAAMCGGFSHAEIEDLAKRADAAPEPLQRGMRATSQRHRAWLSANERRLQMRKKWHAFFGEWDAILLPTLPTTAIPHDHLGDMSSREIVVDGEKRRYAEQTYWVGLTGVSFLPATTVPVGLASDGLPVGLQIAGPFLEDRTTLALAQGVEDALGGFQAPDGY